MTGIWVWETINYLYSVFLLRLQRGWLQWESERQCTAVDGSSGLQQWCVLTQKPPRIWERHRSLKWLAIPFNKLPADWKRCVQAGVAAQTLSAVNIFGLSTCKQSPKPDFKVRRGGGAHFSLQFHQGGQFERIRPHHSLSQSCCRLLLRVEWGEEEPEVAASNWGGHSGAEAAICFTK